MKAVLRFYSKDLYEDRFGVEMAIHDVGVSERYPRGVKYGLICFDQESDRFVLFDNHYPKGPHIHIDNEEFKYKYLDEERLLEDFANAVFEKFGVRL